MPTSQDKFGRHEPPHAKPDVLQRQQLRGGRLLALERTMMESGEPSRMRETRREYERLMKPGTARS